MKSERQSGADRLIAYLAGALQLTLPVAPFERAHDSQSTWAIKKLGELRGQLRILDYGCGNLRLLNALTQTGEIRRIEYCATDTVKPSADLCDSLPLEFIEPDIVHKSSIESFDVIIMMNVIHELPLRDFARAMESARRLLKATGFLLIIDMAVLPEGEFRSLPYYPWELSELFLESADESYSSKKGVPVVASSIPKRGIPVFPQFLNRLCSLVLGKRDVYCELAAALHSRKDEAALVQILANLSLNQGDVHDLGYLMLMSGMANLRLIKHERSKDGTKYEHVASAAEAIMKMFVSTFHAKENNLTFVDVLNRLGATHSYEAISVAVSIMTSGAPSFFLPLYRADLGSSEFRATENFDTFEDHFQYEHISKMGLGTLQDECYRIRHETTAPVTREINQWQKWI